METRKNHGESKRRTRRRRKQKTQVGGGMRIEKWVETLRAHPAYKQNKDAPFESLEYSFAALKESMTGRNLTIDPHDVQSGVDDDDLSRLDPNSGFETPSYLYDVGATLAFLMTETLSEQSATPAKFAALINAMKQAGGIGVGSLEYMTDAENLLRRVAGQLPDPEILSKTDKYPLFIWAVVMNLKSDGNNAVPEPKVPALFTKQAEAEETGANPNPNQNPNPEPTPAPTV
jgi:hypothetical protein